MPAHTLLRIVERRKMIFADFGIYVLMQRTFIGLLKKKGIDLDRKILSTLARENPETFERIVKEVS